MGKDVSHFDVPYIEEDQFGQANWSCYGILVEVPKTNADANELNFETPSRFLQMKQFSYSELKKLQE